MKWMNHKFDLFRISKARESNDVWFRGGLSRDDSGGASFFVDQNYETHGGVLFFYFALVAFTLSRRFFDLFSFMVCLKIYGGAEPKNKFMVEQYWSSFYFLDSTEKIK